MRTLARYCSLSFLPLLFASVSSSAPVWPSQSIYNLNAALVSQSGQSHGLDVYRGHAVLITMFYGSCPAACPLLIDTARAVERAVTPQQRKQLRVLMISIDPERDTTAALAALAKARNIDLTRWTLAHTDDATVRKLAAVLNIQYRKVADGQFSHSSILSVLSRQGEVLQQSSTLGSADAALVAALVGAMGGALAQSK